MALAAKPPQLFPFLLPPVELVVALSNIVGGGGGLFSWGFREEICGDMGTKSCFANGFRKLAWGVEQMDLPGLKRASRSEYLE